MATNTPRRTGQKRGNNEGNIRQRSNGLWEARVTLPSGDRKSIYGKTRAEVQGRLTAALRDVQQGLPVPVGRLTFGQFLARWLEDSVKPKVRAKTHHSYAQLVRVHIDPALGKLPLDQVTPQRIQALLNSKRAAGLSPRTVQYLHAVIRAALGRAVKWNLIARNPATLIDPPRVEQKQVEALSTTHALAIVEAFRGHRMKALITVALAVGLRQGEALGLRWHDLDLDAATLTVRYQVQRIDGEWQFTEPKSKRSRRKLALPTFVVVALRAHRTRQLEERLAAGASWQDWNLVFPSAVGTPYDGTNVTHEFQTRLAAAGLPRMRFHDLRHGAATLLKSKGVDLRDIMEILGHSQISLTANLYTHIAPELMREAAAKMDAIFATS
jgi:integrase